MINYIHKLEAITCIDECTCEFLPRQGLQFGLLPSGIPGCPLWGREGHKSKATLDFTALLRIYLEQVLRVCQRNHRSIAVEVPGHE